MILNNNIYNSIKSVIDQMTNSIVINTVVYNGSESTIYIDSIMLNRNQTLSDGMVVTINNVNYAISNVAINSFTVIGDVSTATEFNIAVNFKYGSRNEINTYLDNKAKSTTSNLKLFPLIWLVSNEIQNYTENQNYLFDSKVLLVFAHETNRDISSEERIDNNFTKVLNPLMSLFLENLKIFPAKLNFNFEYGKLTEYTISDLGRFSTRDQKDLLIRVTDAKELSINLSFANNNNLICN